MQGLLKLIFLECLAEGSGHLGTIFSYMAVGAANPAIAYALSNAAPVVAILWGLFVWKEFKGAPKGTNILLFLMFLGILSG